MLTSLLEAWSNTSNILRELHISDAILKYVEIRFFKIKYNFFYVNSPKLPILKIAFLTC